ncbi:MAG: superoxide dismutase [Acidilobus sp.]
MVSLKRYELPPLPYPYDALEPVLSKETLTYHHDKHHLGYVNGANAALEKLEKYLNGQLESIDIRAVLRDFEFNYGGHILHTLYWYNMAPQGKGGGKPGGAIADAINKTFGSFEKFQRLMGDAAKNVEGVGWAILAYDPVTGELRLLQVEKHNNVVTSNLIPLLAVDVFEHAYYIDYRNDRAKYVDSWWSIVNWDDVEARYQKAINTPKLIL